MNDRPTHLASCRCGQLSATFAGEPVRISVCHCLACQRRSGSAFAAQVRFPASQVRVAGEAACFTATGDHGAAHFHFCPNCSATVYYRNDSLPDTIAVPLGAFDQPRAFTPTFSMFEGRKHDWVEISGDNVEHIA
jgi:hypothetical protein